MEIKKRALISVWNKTGIVGFAKSLVKLGWEIISTGGTTKVLKEAGIKVIPIEKVTKNPEAFDGRMKTISFQVEGALLYNRENLKHQKEAKRLDIQPIDMVVCNLYPFKKVITQKNCTLKQAIENIDIGGPTMIRAAAKNYKYVTVIIDPKDYNKVINILKKKEEIPENTRLKLSKKVFQLTTEYDKNIAKLLKDVF